MTRPLTLHPISLTPSGTIYGDRVSNEWGFNSFVTMAGATAYVRRSARRGRDFYIWRLADSTFDYTMTPDPIFDYVVELVHKGTT